MAKGKGLKSVATVTVVTESKSEGKRFEKLPDSFWENLTVDKAHSIIAEANDSAKSLGLLLPVDFITKAITALKKPYKNQSGEEVIPLGIHSVYSGFNTAVAKYYQGKINPVMLTGAFAKIGAMAIRAVKGGVMLYDADNAPEHKFNAEKTASEVLAKMGIK